ncbi:MAG: MFS transporter, partial [Actinomycetaceae bacterium]|nr:MFS transporter [Actinomycetaceae bacterium]
MSSPSGSANPHITPPTTPGTSAKINGGSPFVSYVFAYTVAALAVFASYSALGNILLPNQVQTIEFQTIFAGTNVTADQLQALADLNNSGTTPTDPTMADNLARFKQYEGARAQSLSTVLAIASVFTLFAQPIVGVLSDRWRSARGRRAFWIAVGTIAGALFMVGLRFSTTLAMLTIFWITTQVALNFAQAPLTTTIADRIPEKRLGMVSGLAGIGMMVGSLLGTVIAGNVFNLMGLDTYYIIGGAVAISGILFVLMAPDTSSKELELEPFDWIGFFKGFAVPLRDHDFLWVWLARFAFMFGFTAINNYTLFILQGYVQPALSVAEANTWAPYLALIGMPGMLIMMLISGQWSDKVGRRKPFVAITAIGFAVALA